MRVAVTGIGVVSPIGNGRDAFWSALLAGTSGVKPVAGFDTAYLPVHAGAEVERADVSAYVTPEQAASIGPAARLAISAAGFAFADAGIDLDAWDRTRIGIAMGTTLGESRFVERYNDLRLPGARDAGGPALLARSSGYVVPSQVASAFDLRGRSIMIPTACAGGNYAIGYGFDLIRSGRADVMLAGGADALSRVTYIGFARIGVIASDRCQPFDKNRTGMIPGEGAALLVLERMDAARARGATIYAEVLGYGVSCDAHGMTGGHPDGDGAIRAMRSALHESGVADGDVDYISAHGTGTEMNDRLESLAVRAVFGERTPRIPMSSIKSMIGHTMGASCGFDAAACALALEGGWVPPTINYEEPDPVCDLDVVANVARRVDPRIVLSNAHAFGGNNASICLGRYEP